MHKSQCERRRRIININIIVRALIIFNLYANVPVSEQTAAVRLHLHEDHITNHNDSDYVGEVTRRAKAAEMLNYMDADAYDPCEHFFAFACGRWPKIYPAQGASPRETKFVDLLAKAYAVKQMRLLTEGRRKTDTAIDGLVMDFYESCLEASHLRTTTFKMRLRRLLAEFGAMPAIDGTYWSETNFDWVATIAAIRRRFGENIILQLSWRPDFNNNNNNNNADNNNVSKLIIGQATLRLGSQAMYLNEATHWHRMQYKAEITNNLVDYLGLEPSAADVVATEILAFETRLARGYGKRIFGFVLRSTMKATTIDELAATYAPDIDFRRYVDLVVGATFNDTLYEYLPESQENLRLTLRETPPRHLANYIFYQLAAIFFLGVNETAAQSRQRLCYEKTKVHFGRLLDNMIYRKYNSDDAQKDIQLMWQRLKSTFKAQLMESPGQLDWMSDETKKLALTKLETLQLRVNSYTDPLFVSLYANLSLNNQDYLENIQRILEYETRNAMETETATTAAGGRNYIATMPHYHTTENVIAVPVSLLQHNILWSEHYPASVKYGTLGYLLAHELLHAFDELGREYNAAGQQRDDDTWWDAQTREAFDERKECFRDQYSRYRYGGKYLPESELQAENIADNGAIRIANMAFMRATEMQCQRDDHTNDTNNERTQCTVLPNMNYTSQQLFFISFAQFWCNDVDEHFKDKVALVDLQTPAMFRVQGPLANYDAFAAEFKCDRGTTMNPEKKCQLY